MYKVFFKESCFLLTDDENLCGKGKYCLRSAESIRLQQFIWERLNGGDSFTAVIYHPNLEELMEIFKSCFFYVKAAGGVVFEQGNIAVIRRLGMYDLPKGHLETGESIEACAVREVEEECGLKGVKITNYLTHTWHLYFRNGKWHLKETFWYAMTCPPHSVLTPQQEEDIESAFWFPITDIDRLFSETYASLMPVFQKIKEV